MRTRVALASITTAAALAGAALPAAAVVAPSYSFAGTVTSIPAGLAGGGIALGDAVQLSVTLRPPVPDTDPTFSVGSYTGAIDAWTMTIGSFVSTGAGGDVLVCDSPSAGALNCGSVATYGWWNGIWAGKDGVRFVARQLTSVPIVLNGITQACGLGDASCGNANVYDDSALALTSAEIPPVLDPVTFGSATNNGRLLFGNQGGAGFIGFSVAVVPEAPIAALMGLGLGLVGAVAGRRRTGRSNRRRT